MFQFWPHVVKPILDAVSAKRVVEVGIDTGRHSRHLVAWAKGAHARIDLVDPEPSFDVGRLRDRFGDVVTFHRRPSLDVLPDLRPADVVLLDGDHNWYTVFHELQAIYGTQGPLDAQAPITVCHDVEWPYARRDLYYAPARIPADFRHEYSIGGVLPEDPGLSPNGQNAGAFHALREGGPRNGVKTAIEDFLAERGETFRIVWIPFLFGLAVIVPKAQLENAALTAHLDALELTRPLRSLCKLAELDRVSALRPRPVPARPDGHAQTGDRPFSSALPDTVLTGLLEGISKYRYKGRAMLLNPLDLANYLALIGQIKPAAVIEIGSFEGGRTEWLADTMSNLGLPVRVISVDLVAPSHATAPGVEIRQGDARDLAIVLPPEEVRSLGHPLLVIEDSAHDEATCSAVLSYFDPLLQTGDYIVVEDGVFRSSGEKSSAASFLSPPARAIDGFLARRGQYYEIDTAVCDRFGYNSTFNPNGWLRRK